MKKIEKVTQNDIIKTDNNVNKNYVVMVSAKWCPPCQRMYPIMEELKKEGYIVYIFDVTKAEYRGYAKSYKVNFFPTFIIFDRGKIVNRTIGTTNKTWFQTNLKTKLEQVIKPPSNPYDEI